MPSRPAKGATWVQGARKVRTPARRAGVHTFLAPWTQIAPFAGRLGIPRLQAPEAGGERRQRPAPPGSPR